MEKIADVGLLMKLDKIQSSILALKKDAESGSGKYGYEYLTGNKLLEAIKPIMVENHLLLIPRITNLEHERRDYTVSGGRSKSEELYVCHIDWIWIDCETGFYMVCPFAGTGMNEWEKGFGSVLTYSERYFIMKSFHIQTDKDDIDNPERKNLLKSMAKEIVEHPMLKNTKYKSWLESKLKFKISTSVLLKQSEEKLAEVLNKLDESYAKQQEKEKETKEEVKE